MKKCMIIKESVKTAKIKAPAIAGADFMKSILDREIKVCKFYGININE